MQKLILALTVLAGLQAHARTHNPKLNEFAELNKFQFQTGSSLAQRDISYGSVSVDTVSKKIRLVLQPAFHCPAGAMCAMVMPMAIEFEVPLQSIERGGCQEVIYKGAHNMMPVDGALTEITVTDNRNNMCESFAIIPLTEVQLHTQVPRPYRDENHVMQGESMKPYPFTLKH